MVVSHGLCKLHVKTMCVVYSLITCSVAASYQLKRLRNKRRKINSKQQFTITCGKQQISTKRMSLTVNAKLNVL